MEFKDEISVVIPTYNRAADLLKAVNSVLNQTFPVLEILICDDGSTDNSRQLIEQLNHPKVIWLNCGRNGMPAIPRNKGILSSRGQWVAFLDSDDEWLPDKIEKQTAAITAAGFKAICCNANKITKGKTPVPYLSYTRQEIDFFELYETNQVICSSMLVKKEALLQAGLFPEGKEFKAIEDYCLWLKIAVNTTVGYSNQALVNYTDEPSQSLRKKGLSAAGQKQIITRELLTWLDKQQSGSSKKIQDYLHQTLEQQNNVPLKTKLWRFKNRIIAKFKG